MARLLQANRASKRVLRPWLALWMQRRRRKRAADHAAPAPGVPAAPENLAAEDLYTFVQLAWDDMASDELGFRIYRDGAVIAELGPNSSGYDDHTAQYGTRVYYVVAYNAYGESAHSNQISIAFGA